jgi:nicotinamidase-related amidase
MVRTFSGQIRTKRSKLIWGANAPSIRRELAMALFVRFEASSCIVFGRDAQHSGVRRGNLMSTPATALLVIDVQESFRHRPYWCVNYVPPFVERLQALIDGAEARKIPVVQIFHVEDSGPFSMQSGHVVTMQGVSLAPAATFYKRSHSALIGSGLGVWLTQHGIGRVITSGIRSEQCCETTTRHASDLGYRVDYVTEATLTFPMTDRRGRLWTPEAIKARTELVLDGRFARIVTVEEALAGGVTELVG